MFRAEHFDPAAWVDLFVNAGARYVVPVAEHCDGFAMYASDMTPWNAAAMGPHRDVVGELAGGDARAGLALRCLLARRRALVVVWRGPLLRFRVRTAMSSTPAPLDAQLYGPAEAMNPPGPNGDVAAHPQTPRSPTHRTSSSGCRPIRHGSTTGSRSPPNSSINITPRLFLLRFCDRPTRL